jgi:hypothetical protein
MKNEMKHGAKKLYNLVVEAMKPKDDNTQWVDINDLWPQIDTYNVFETNMSQAEVQ